MPATCDAVVIGAGVNGLSLALRLRRAGLRTLVVEQAAFVGGMARTEEPLLAGFRHNPHANYLAYGAVNPLERAFDFASAGLVTLTPEAQHGLCFADGRPPLILYRNDLTQRSGESLRQYSDRDAHTYVRLKGAANALSPVMAKSLYSPPARESASRLVAAADHIFGGALNDRSARDVIDTLFEADEVRSLFYQLAAETGLSIETPGSGVGFLTFTLWLVGQLRLPVGGMRAYADAIAETARREGVEFALDAPVESITLQAGRAVGVTLAGHGHVGARAVASSAGVYATLAGMVPDAAFSAQESARILAYAATEGPTLATLIFCLSAPPAYSSARWNADIDRCFRTLVGYGGARETLAHLRDIERGMLPPPSAALRVNSLWDPSQAPAGRHVAGGDVLMPAPSSFDPSDWEAVSASFIEAFIEVWGSHAPNMTPDTVLAGRFMPPERYDRALLLGEGTGQYRTGIERLYLCGASTWPGGGAHGACGYNAFGAIAEDLGLKAATRRD
ncbi:MAG: NAD(P)/FAD-dependent oxidoreductase [Hyphomonadaceae bacterium]|nr:NAD(P)/FAD-dependent oxidoreductase [Hyphomonadaceae bacterium]